MEPICRLGNDLRPKGDEKKDREGLQQNESKTQQTSYGKYPPLSKKKNEQKVERNKDGSGIIDMSLICWRKDAGCTEEDHSFSKDQGQDGKDQPAPVKTHAEKDSNTENNIRQK